jgi:hypothetical protein
MESRFVENVLTFAGNATDPSAPIASAVEMDLYSKKKLALV